MGISSHIASNVPLIKPAYMVVSATNAQSANHPRGSVCIRKNAEIVGSVDAAEFVRTTREGTIAVSAKELDTVRIESINFTAYNATDLISALTKDPRGCSMCSIEKCEDTVRRGNIKVIASFARDPAYATMERIQGDGLYVPTKSGKDAGYGWCGGRRRMENDCAPIATPTQNEEECTTNRGKKSL